MEDGQISNLKIDGKEIPAEAYDQHENLIQEMVLEFENIPTPPTPPSMITEAPMPPSPPSAVPESPMPPAEVRKTKIAMEKHHKKMEQHHKEMEKHHKKMAKQREEMLERHTQKMEAHRIKMEKHHEKMAEHHEEMNIERIERQETIEEIDDASGNIDQIIAKNIGRANNEINKAIEDQLLADGLIDSRANYAFELTGKKLKVNRKTQSNALHQKYKQLYGELSGSPLSEKSRLKVVKSKN